MKNNNVKKIVDWHFRVSYQSGLIINSDSKIKLIKALHKEVYGTLSNSSKMNSRLLFQSLVLSHLKDNYPDIYKEAIMH